MRDKPDDNSPHHVKEQPSGSDGEPKFGRLLLLLAFGLAMVVALTFGSVAFYSP